MNRRINKRIEEKKSNIRKKYFSKTFGEKKLLGMPAITEKEIPIKDENPFSEPDHCDERKTVEEIKTQGGVFCPQCHNPVTFMRRRKHGGVKKKSFVETKVGVFHAGCYDKAYRNYRSTKRLYKQLGISQ